MLAAYSEGEHELLHHDERFPIDTADEVWIRSIGAERPPWVVISADLAILDRPPEREALEEMNLTFFGFEKRWLNMAFSEQAWRLVKVWPAIIQKAERSADSPTVYKVHWGSSGEIEELGHTRRSGRGRR